MTHLLRPPHPSAARSTHRPGCPTGRCRPAGTLVRSRRSSSWATTESPARVTACRPRAPATCPPTVASGCCAIPHPGAWWTVPRATRASITSRSILRRAAHRRAGADGLPARPRPWLVLPRRGRFRRGWRRPAYRRRARLTQAARRVGRGAQPHPRGNRPRRGSATTSGARRSAPTSSTRPSDPTRCSRCTSTRPTSRCSATATARTARRLATPARPRAGTAPAPAGSIDPVNLTGRAYVQMIEQRHVVGRLPHHGRCR